MRCNFQIFNIKFNVSVNSSIYSNHEMSYKSTLCCLTVKSVIAHATTSFKCGYSISIAWVCITFLVQCILQMYPDKQNPYGTTIIVVSIGCLEFGIWLPIGYFLIVVRDDISPQHGYRYPGSLKIWLQLDSGYLLSAKKSDVFIVTNW